MQSDHQQPHTGGWALRVGHGAEGADHGAGITADGLVEWSFYRDHALASGVAQSDLLLEKTARNTAENAAYGAALVESELGWNSVRKIAVCCKPFHMRRAIMTLRRYIPEDVRIIAQPPLTPAICPPRPGGRRSTAATACSPSWGRLLNMRSRVTWVTSELPKLHLIGVGGSGMFPLALLLRQAGYEVSGSDSNCSKERLDLLLANGIRVQAAAMRDVDGVIVSPAIPESHAELRAARRDSIPVQTRARALAELIAQRPSICVAGSHGKSTTTAMLVHILDYAGPSDCGHMLGASFACGTLPPRASAKRKHPS
ncbi:Mur ligase domain-containing protein [Paracoccus cavernae]|uniref:Mur ligase domain-containing protein n=1 Tax=Paracoccus cavernae TaxID=1571207 RepID=UPI0036343330